MCATVRATVLYKLDVALNAGKNLYGLATTFWEDGPLSTRIESGAPKVAPPRTTTLPVQRPLFSENRSDITFVLLSQAWFRHGTPKPDSIDFNSEKWV